MHLIAAQGPLLGLILDFEDGKEWFVGRDPDQVDFVIEDKTVSRKHVKFTKDENGIHIQNLSATNPCEINDIPVEDETLLHEGDRVKIGHNIFIFSESDTPTEEEEKILEQKQAMAQEEYEANEGDDDDDDDEFIEDVLPEEPQDLKKKENKKNAFDTIFEDVPEDDLDFTNDDETNILLKVISGPNSGAEFGMHKDKSYIIGKDPNVCDIIFNDLSVSKRHAKISIDENGDVFIEDLGSKNKTYVNSEEITKRTKISAEDIISIGTTTFFVVDKEASTETIYSPYPLSTKPARKAADKDLVAEKDEKEKEILSWRDQIIPTKHLIFAGSLVFIVFVVFLSFFSLFKTQRIEVSAKKPTEEINHIVNNYKEVKFTFNPASGNLFLVGHVLTNIDHQELMYSLNEKTYIDNIEDNVVIDEKVWKNTNDILTQNPQWRSISLYSPNAGKFILTGYVNSLKEKEMLDDYLNINFPYLDKLENQIAVEEILKHQIASMLISEGLGTLEFNLTNGEIVLSGFFEAKKAKELGSLIKHLNLINGVRDIKNLTVASSNNIAQIDLTKNYKVSGYAKHNDDDYSVIVNGELVSIGDNLDGMNILNIKDNSIFLEKEGVKYKINYKQ
jgi:type III secretion system YscD/HrpQ family protein